MKARVKYFLMGLAIATAALAGCSSLSTDARMAITCQSYASTLSSLSELRAQGELSQEQINQVDAAITVAGPICRDDTVEEGEVEQLGNALRELSTVQQNADEGGEE